MKNKLRGALRSMTIWVNTIFLALLANADFIALALSENLPFLGSVLRAELVQALSIALGLFNLYQRARTSKSLAEKGAP